MFEATFILGWSNVFGIFDVQLLQGSFVTGKDEFIEASNSNWQGVKYCGNSPVLNSLINYLH